MKNIGLVLVAASMLCGTAVTAQEAGGDTAIVKQTVQAADAAAPIALDMPARRSRKRLLVDLGLFGMGFQIGWMKPKSSLDPEVSDHHIGTPIFNVSGGSHAIGLGTR